MSVVLEWGAAPEQAQQAVLAVHGRGQSPRFMQETAARFAAPHARFHAPEAPGNTWYPLPFLEPLERNRPVLDRSLDVIDRCLVELAERGAARERTVLWGFSQGACLLAQYVLTVSPEPFGGLILFTGGYLGTGPVAAPPAGSLDGLEVLVRSIANDPWVPRHRVEDTAEVLRRAGARVDLRIDPGAEHVITDEACSAAGALISTVGRVGPGAAEGEGPRRCDSTT